MWRHVIQIARNDAAISVREPTLFAVLVGMPVLLIGFMRPIYGIVLLALGYRGADGSELAVPGMATMFAFFLVSYVGHSVVDEHQWRTWDRLLASNVSVGAVVVGKCVTPFGMALLQQALLFWLGMAVFGLRVRGSLAAVAVIACALACSLVTAGVALAAFARTARHVSAFANLTLMVFAGLGGALTPVSLLPAWAQRVAPAVPSYWALQGFRTAVLDGASVAGVAEPAAVLLCFAIAFASLATLRFRRPRT